MAPKFYIHSAKLYLQKLKLYFYYNIFTNV